MGWIDTWLGVALLVLFSPFILLILAMVLYVNLIIIVIVIDLIRGDH